eukprot:gene3429-3061_t
MMHRCTGRPFSNGDRLYTPLRCNTTCCRLEAVVVCTCGRCARFVTSKDELNLKPPSLGTGRRTKSSSSKLSVPKSKARSTSTSASASTSTGVDKGELQAPKSPRSVRSKSKSPLPHGYANPLDSLDAYGSAISAQVHGTGAGKAGIEWNREMSSHTKGSSSPRVGRRMVARAGSGGDVIVRTGDAAVSAPRTKSKKVGKHSYPAGAKRGGIAAARSNSTESRAPLPAAKTYGVGNGPPRSMPKKWVASSKRGKTIKAIAGTATLRFDLYRDLFELGPDGSVHGSDINSKFDLQESFKGDYRLRVRGPGMLGPYLEEGEGSGALPASSDERSYLLGAERAKPCVIGMKPKAEYWVEIIPAELESVSLDMIALKRSAQDLRAATQLPVSPDPLDVALTVPPSIVAASAAAASKAAADADALVLAREAQANAASVRAEALAVLAASAASPPPSPTKLASSSLPSVEITGSPAPSHAPSTPPAAAAVPSAAGAAEASSSTATPLPSSPTPAPAPAPAASDAGTSLPSLTPAAPAAPDSISEQTIPVSPTATKFCQHCGAAFQSGARFCGGCGLAAPPGAGF